ncbi:phosphoesterase PA-phosphatase related protein [Desulfovibrio sp. X2]|uniref:phosphatase PAP2 family protein n=1 Tax=Desulfovibrio sp. X2 TaxID=941449 RepID=UPI000358993B|nr:phosphatase PAP2 family protein [Desulfovibrio sp. X2]EPR40241.1 phosphoesterase PA-phosphatase related protein [Desulfovibrio sp. X2]
MHFATPGWDLALFRLLNGQARAAFLDLALPVFSMTWLIWVLGVAAFVLAARRIGVARVLPVALCLVLAVGLADGTTSVMKTTFGRQRPLNTLPGAWFHEDGRWQQRPADFAPDLEPGSSYSSGHAANTMAAAAFLLLALWRQDRRRLAWLLCLPLLTGWSRVYLGKHYPTDVMAGWIVGLFAALVVWGVVWRFARPRLAARFSARLGPWLGGRDALP